MKQTIVVENKPGGGGALMMRELLDKAGLKMNHVPFPGSQAVTAAVAGDAPVAITGVVDSASFVRSGQLNALAVTGTRRLPLMPQMPTLTETGLSGIEYGVWAGLIAPKRTPSDVVQRLNAALQAAGALIHVGSAADMHRQVSEETIFWRGVVERAGIKAE